MRTRAEDMLANGMPVEEVAKTWQEWSYLEHQIVLRAGLGKMLDRIQRAANRSMGLASQAAQRGQLTHVWAMPLPDAERYYLGKLHRLRRQGKGVQRAIRETEALVEEVRAARGTGADTMGTYFIQHPERQAEVERMAALVEAVA